MKTFKLQHTKSLAIFTSNMVNGILCKLLLSVALNCVLVHCQFRNNGNFQFQGAGNDFQGYQQPHPNQGFHQQQEKKKPDIIPATFSNSLNHDGSRNFGFQTADGQQRSETTDADGTVRGSYSYMGPDGKEVKINYIADKNGFQASGPTIPKPPPAAAATANAGAGKKQQDYDYDDGSSHESGEGNGGGRRHHGGRHHGGGHFNFAPQNFQEQHIPRFGAANQQQPQPQQFRPYFGNNDYDDGYSGSNRREYGGGYGGQSQESQFAPRRINENQSFNKFVDNSQF